MVFKVKVTPTETNWWHSTIVQHTYSWQENGPEKNSLHMTAAWYFFPLLCMQPRPLSWLLPAVNKLRVQRSRSSLLKHWTILPCVKAAGMPVATPVSTAFVPPTSPGFCGTTITTTPRKEYQCPLNAKANRHVSVPYVTEPVCSIWRLTWLTTSDHFFQ